MRNRYTKCSAIRNVHTRVSKESNFVEPSTEYIRRTEQLGMPCDENYDRSYRITQMRTMCRLFIRSGLLRIGKSFNLVWYSIKKKLLLEYHSAPHVMVSEFSNMPALFCGSFLNIFCLYIIAVKYEACMYRTIHKAISMTFLVINETSNLNIC